MCTMKRLGLLALLVLTMMPLALAPAQAKQDEYDSEKRFELINTGVEPLATGQMTQHTKFIRTKHPEYEESYYQTTVSVRCQGLTPGATYVVEGIGGFMHKTFIADKKGNGQVSGEVISSGEPWGPVSVGVSRLDPDGSSTLVLTSW